MRFTHNGINYVLDFQREHKPVTKVINKTVITGPSQFPYTTVTLYTRLPDGKLEVYRTATVGCHFRDRKLFTLERGRLHAMRLMSKTLDVGLKQVMWLMYMGRGSSSKA